MSDDNFPEWNHSHDYVLRSGLGSGSKKTEWYSFDVEPSKVVLSIHGSGISDGLFLWHCLLLALVCGQAPRVVYSEDSLAQYRMRKGDPQQAKVKLYAFDAIQFVRFLVERGCVNLREFTTLKTDWPARNPDGSLNLALPLMGGLMSEHGDLVGNRPLPTLHIQITWKVPLPVIKKKLYGEEKKKARLQSSKKATVRSKLLGDTNPWYCLAGDFNGRKRTRTERWKKKHGKNDRVEISVSDVSYYASQEEKRLEKLQNEFYARSFLTVGISKMFPMKK